MFMTYILSNLFFMGIISIILFIMAIHDLIGALYFKESAATYGFYVGKKNNEYLYWGVIRFVVFIILGIDILFRLNDKKDTSLL
jgi:hypothetical protein